LLIVLPFGLMAPLLAGMIIISIFIETFARQMVLVLVLVQGLGRFLVNDFGVVLARLPAYDKEAPFQPECLFTVHFPRKAVAHERGYYVACAGAVGGVRIAARS